MKSSTMSVTRALLLIDLQNDFCPGGALAVPAGDRVIPVANRVLHQFDLCIATQDWHPGNHVSFASNHPGARTGDVIELDGHSQTLWPDHCVQGTRGAEFVGELDTDRIDKIFHKGTNPAVDSYSGFFDNRRLHSTGLAEFLKNHKVKELTVLGLATDYCVKFSVLDAVESGFQVQVIRKGCRGVELNPGDVEQAWQEIQAAGARLI